MKKSQAKAQSPRSTAHIVRRRLLQFLGIFVLGVTTGVGVAAVIKIPSVDAIGDFSPGLITEVQDAHGVPFRTYAIERRMLLEEGEISPVLRQALLAAEDKNFYEHGGLDLAATVRSAIINLRRGRRATGASTITMQLARTYFNLSREKKWQRKVQETLISVELEKRLSKEQILTLYCNIINLGEGRYGMKAAADYYFGKSVADLTLSEATSLTAIIPRPSERSPYRRPDVVIRERNVILGRMLQEKMISKEDYDTATSAPLDLITRKRTPEPGRYFAEDVRRYMETNHGVDSLYQRGLRIHTTLDLPMQRAAERAVRNGLSRLDRRKGWRRATRRLDEGEVAETVELASWPEQLQLEDWYEGVVLEVDREVARIRIGNGTFVLDLEGADWTGTKDLRRLFEAGEIAWFELLELEESQAEADQEITVSGRLALRQEPQIEAALLMIESSSGAVRAMVGGWDYGRSQFNRATQARRQVGSAFKPFVFGAALEAGYTPADTIFDAPVVFPGADLLMNYSPRNYKREYLGIITLRRALEKSINLSTTKLLDMVGAERVIDFANRCGIEADLPPYPSLALGAADLTPLELASAYATLGNQGVRVEPYLIERITTRDGRLIEEHIPRAVEVIEPEVAYVLTHMLQGVFRRGTAVSAADLPIAVAGKTGTTDSYTDAWFAGFTPRYSLLVWVGYDQVRYLGPGMTGAAAALPIWRSVIDQGLSDGWLQADEKFLRPPGVSTRRVEYNTGLLATHEASRTLDESFIAGTEPVQTYDPSWNRVIGLPWFQQRPFYGLPKEGERMPEDIDDWSLVLERWESKD